jgi:hypothetical protein
MFVHVNLIPVIRLEKVKYIFKVYMLKMQQAKILAVTPVMKGF